MAPTVGKHAIGPSNGSLHLRTTRAGMAAKVGHDLHLKVTRWSGHVDLPDLDDLSTAGVFVAAELDSLEVVEGTGGVAPLDDRDKADILKNAAKTLRVDRQRTAEFTATEVRPGADGDGEIEGTLNLAGATGKLTLSVAATGDAKWRATGTVVQSDYGIAPYRAFLGALRLADAVTVEAEISLDPR